MTKRRAPTLTARRYDKNRPWRKLYDTKRWKVLRAQQLAKCPLCWMCERSGQLTAASVVDHIKAHKGDEDLFFDPDNLASLCPTHHDSSKQKAERRGVQEIGCETDGVPLDPCHHWHT